MFNARKSKSVLTNSMGNGIKPPVQDLWLPGRHTPRTKYLCFAIPSVPAQNGHSRNFPLDHNTLGRTTIVWVQMSGKCTAVEEIIIERTREKRERQ